ncbi:hypothetical protein NC652_037909 [Populus alba x Populus x berolinensis]|nr:hypothetical protein NC652_037909 [Populus alba x Populus x berolinensis]
MFSTINDFYLSGLLPTGVINSSFITLGPQVAGAHNNLKRLQTSNELKAVMHSALIASEVSCQLKKKGAKRSLF